MFVSLPTTTYEFTRLKEDWAKTSYEALVLGSHWLAGGKSWVFVVDAVMRHPDLPHKTNSLILLAVGNVTAKGSELCLSEDCVQPKEAALPKVTPLLGQLASNAW